MKGLAAGAIAVLLLIATTVRAEDNCTCDENRTRAGWCDSHAIGYVAGVEIRSEELFEALDAHGHEIDDRYLDCETCKQAKEYGGYCEEHGRGFVDGLAYMSRLTYHLAEGLAVDPDAIDCPVCRKNATSHGWCAKCGKGMFGAIEVEGRQTFQNVDRELHILIDARRTVPRCELCAAAMITDGRCPVCKISYRNGKPTAD